MLTSAQHIVSYRGLSIVVATGMQIGYVVTDAFKWEVDTERDALEFDVGYYGKLLEKAWDEAAFVFQG
jgi:DNA polymerase, archaea type